jgi:hypothetical protein
MPCCLLPLAKYACKACKFLAGNRQESTHLSMLIVPLYDIRFLWEEWRSKMAKCVLALRWPVLDEISEGVPCSSAATGGVF